MEVSLSPERELVLRALSRDRHERDAAFSAVVQAIGPALRALCLGVTGNGSDADDALQDTLLTLASELGRFRGDARLYTWCYRIALRAFSPR